ncbi:MAG: hypothetical protein V4592_26805 [Bacteroidota bacterium]
MKRYFIILLLITLTGCKNHLVNNSGVKMIKVVIYRDESDSITVDYTNAAKIKRIMNTLNHNYECPLHFETNCTLHVIYADSVATIYCNGASIKYNNVTYQLKNSMQEAIN